MARGSPKHEPVPDRIKGARALRDIASAIKRRASTERDIAAVVTVTRRRRSPLGAIGAMLGTSGEAACQRYGTPAHQGGRSGRPRRRGSRTANCETI